MISFHDLEMKFGPALAYQFLIEIEKAARIEAEQITGLDPETRLANACRVQDEMTEALLAA
jgi:hypothetical protein